MSQHNSGEEDFNEGDDDDQDNDMEYGKDESEDDLEDDEDFIPSNDPKWASLQNVLQQQLDSLYDTVEVAVRDKQAEKKKLSEDRETVGVELYTMQQQLAKIQTRLTDANEEKTQYEQSRVEAEDQVKKDREILEANQADLQKRNADYESRRNELDKLNEIVLRLEQHNQETLNQVAVTKRETYKSEQAASDTEVSKQEQDMYIDRLTQQQQDKTKELNIIEAQILAQRAETKTARDALLQATLEMDKIQFERNHLIQEWNSSLISVQRRNQTLTEVRAAATKQEEEIHALQNEANSLKAQINDQHDKSERNVGLLNKINARLSALDTKIKETESEHNQLQSQLENLYKLAAEKEQVISKLLIEKNAANAEFKQSMKGANEISNQIHEIEDLIIKHTTEQSNLKRDVGVAQNEVQKIRDEIVAKDRELSNLENEVVRLRIDKLNISAQCEKLERAKSEIVKELQSKEDLITQYESQIRKNDVEIEKRQSEVDKLNRQYDALTSAQNGEEYGPLERKIRQIQSRIEQSDQTNSESQETWLKKQTELVAITHDCEDLEDLNQKQAAHIAVLSKKRDRTRIQLEATEKEIERLNIQIRLLQREMSRLGQQLSEHNGSGNNLVEGNVNFESEILETLQKKEEESAKIESHIDELVHQRDEIKDDILETERQIMSWEKKLTLAKEMKEALDPNYGAGQLKTMKKEVSRMELRLKQLEKQQQTIIQEMEFALKRRETIANRGAVQKRLNKDKTRADVTKGITDLKRDIAKINNEAKNQEREMQENLVAQQEIAAEIEELGQVMREYQAKKRDLEMSLAKEERNNSETQIRLLKLQEKSRMFTSKRVTTIKTPEAYETEMTRAKDQEEKLKQLIDSLSSNFPQLTDDFEVVKTKLFTV